MDTAEKRIYEKIAAFQTLVFVSPSLSYADCPVSHRLLKKESYIRRN